jgi:intracellular septation protein
MTEPSVSGSAKPKTSPVQPGAKPPVAPWVHLAINYAGPAAFLAAYLLRHDILVATWALVAGSAVALAAGFAVERRVAPLPLIWGLAALVFGVLTLVFHDPRIIKMKTTIIDAALGLGLLGGLALGHSPIRILMGDTLALPEDAWRKLTLRFGLFFLVLAAANEVIWRTQSEAVWVAFRFPGLLIISLVFSGTQIPLMLKQAEAAQAAVNLAETQE